MDPTFGNDATAVDESPVFAYQTINAAITSAAVQATSSGPWQVQIRPGTYTENVLLRNYVNLLGVSTNSLLGPPILLANEVQIIGTIDDALVTAGPLNLGNLAVISTDMHSGNFANAFLITIVDCQFASTFTSPPPTTPVAAIDHGNGVGLSIRRSHIRLVVQSDDVFDARVINMTGAATSILLEDCFIDNIPLGGLTGVPAGPPTLTHVSASGIGSPTALMSITSTTCRYSVGFQIPSLAPTTCTYQTFAVDNGSVASRNDQVEIAIVPAATTVAIANAGFVGTGAISIANVINMFVDLLSQAVPIRSNISTFNNNGFANSRGFFQDIRFTNFNGGRNLGLGTGGIPTQTPANTTNNFKQVNVLADDQGGGGDLASVVYLAAPVTNYAVQPADSVILSNPTATTGVITVTLPSTAANLGRRVWVKNITASGLATNIAPTGTDLVEGNNPFVLNPGVGVVVISDGVGNWWVFASFP